MELNIFYNYAVHILIPENADIDEPELKYVGEKYQDKNELILHNTIMNARWKKITDSIKGFSTSSRTVRKFHVEILNSLPLLKK